MKKEHFGQLDKKTESQNQKEKQPGFELFIAMFSSRRKSGTAPMKSSKKQKQKKSGTPEFLYPAKLI